MEIVLGLMSEGEQNILNRRQRNLSMGWKSLNWIGSIQIFFSS